MPGDEPHDEPGPRTRIAEIERLRWFPEAADTNPPDPPRAVVQAVHARAEPPHAFRRCEHVLAFQQPFDPGFANRERAQNERAMRD